MSRSVNVSYTLVTFSSGVYSIAEAEGVSRGTKIVIDLRDNAQEFAKKKNVESKYFAIAYIFVSPCAQT